MEYYLFMFVASSLLLYIGQRHKNYSKIFYFCALAMPILMAGYRGISVGADTVSYLRIYNIIYEIKHYTPIVEPIFYVIARLAMLFDSFTVVLIVYQGLSILFIYKFAINFCKSSNLWFVFILYYFIMFNPSLNTMRQSLAVCYFLYITNFLHKNRKLKYILFAILGVLIHTTEILAAIVYLVIYNISTNTKKYRNLSILGFTLILILTIILLPYILKIFMVMGNDFISNKAEAYQSEDSKINMIYLLTSCFMFLVYIICCEYKIMNKNKRCIFYCIIICELIFSIMGVYNVVFSRLSFYFTAFYLYFIPIIYKSAKCSIQNRRLIKIIFLSYFLFYWFWIIAINNSNLTIPYEIS